MFVLGLTGGIGSGKTAVSDRFEKKGITVVDADLCSRVVVEPGRPALQAIKDHFGEAILQTDGTLNRAELRQRIFANTDEKQWLESLLHPLIGEELFNQLCAAQSDYVILVSPLLIESQQNQICDHILVVDAPEETQINRTVSRDDNDADQVKRIMVTQASREERLQHANDIIENTQGLEYLDQRVDELHQQYIDMAKHKTNSTTEN